MTTGDVPCPNCGGWACSGINCPGPMPAWAKPDRPAFVHTQPMVYNMTLLPLLSKRELFAAMAMQGIIANPGTNGADIHAVVAESAVEQADALLAALEGKGE